VANGLAKRRIIVPRQDVVQQEVSALRSMREREREIERVRE
jgi:hypothetical protein